MPDLLKTMAIWHNGVEWVAALSAEAATQFLMEFSGYDREEAENDGWTSEDPDKNLTVKFDALMDVPDWAMGRWTEDDPKVKATFREWAENFTGQAGFIASTEH